MINWCSTIQHWSLTKQIRLSYHLQDLSHSVLGDAYRRQLVTQLFQMLMKQSHSSGQMYNLYLQIRPRNNNFSLCRKNWLILNLKGWSRANKRFTTAQFSFCSRSTFLSIKGSKKWNKCKNSNEEKMKSWSMTHYSNSTVNSSSNKCW